MKIRELDLDQYVIVYDIGKSEDHNGMTVVGRVEEIVFNDDSDNVATINSLGNLYEITDDNEFELWAKSIEGKTESIGTTIKWNDDGNLEIEDNYEIKVPDDVLNNNSNLVGYVKDEINTYRSNDVQQKKRFEHLGVKSNDTVNHPSHYNYGDIEVIDYCDQVCKTYPPELAPYVFNAIKYLSRANMKNGREDIAKAKYFVERLFDKWDVK
ncbi:DUF3310 domain-containing protein [Staphylococcus equorum]|uniref:DUF3310 domain-containing protein n=1 Tax=Staphylococcus equorum TaxID=246432 RepID=UPI000A6D8375|nr:DUF3310 domain-containing protein [Staphylococcus equorum]